MANLQRLLGSMLATGVGGHSRRGPAFASSTAGLGAASLLGGRGGLSQKAGLAALGYLAYKAYQDYQAGSAGRTSDQASPGSGRPDAGPSLGERLAGMLGGGQEREEPPSMEQISDAKALLLIRAMIAAANADGEISADERRQIMTRVDEAGAEPEERRAIEQELARPRSVDEIAREVQDEDTAEQVYLASRVAINPDAPAERAYLQYLAARLKLPEQRIQDIQAVA